MFARRRPPRPRWAIAIACAGVLAFVVAFAAFGGPHLSVPDGGTSSDTGMPSAPTSTAEPEMPPTLHGDQVRVSLLINNSGPASLVVHRANSSMITTESPVVR